MYFIINNQPQQGNLVSTFGSFHNEFDLGNLFLYF